MLEGALGDHLFFLSAAHQFSCVWLGALRIPLSLCYQFHYSTAVVMTIFPYCLISTYAKLLSFLLFSSFLFLFLCEQGKIIDLNRSNTVLTDSVTYARVRGRQRREFGDGIFKSINDCLGFATSQYNVI